MKSAMLVLLALSGCIVLTGCQGSVDYEGVFSRLDQTTLRYSSSAEVLGMIKTGDDEFLSQSESVVASWGEKKGKVLWFNMVAFDEEELTAARKYTFASNAKATGYLVLPAKRLQFEANMILDSEVVDEPYANQNVRRIAILRAIQSNFSDDIGQLTADSWVLQSGSMMGMRAINAVLNKLDRTPAYAVELERTDGLGFDHMTLGKGRAYLHTGGQMVELRIKIGKKSFNRSWR